MFVDGPFVLFDNVPLREKVPAQQPDPWDGLFGAREVIGFLYDTAQAGSTLAAFTVSAEIAEGAGWVDLPAASIPALEVAFALPEVLHAGGMAFTVRRTDGGLFPVNRLRFTADKAVDGRDMTLLGVAWAFFDVYDRPKPYALGDTMIDVKRGFSGFDKDPDG